MAGNFTINVVVSGAGTGGNAGSGGGDNRDITNSAVLGGLDKSKLTPPQQVIAKTMSDFASSVGAGTVVTPLQSGAGGFTASSYFGQYNRRYGKFEETEQYSFSDPIQIRKQSLFRRAMWQTTSTTTRASLDDETGQYTGMTPTSAVESFKVGDSLATEHIKANAKRYNALAVSTAYKALQSSVNITQHQSGDAYFNKQINNGLKLAGYASMIAVSGPLAGFVTAGIAINEVGEAVTGLINYNFDRKLERQEITNSLALAGNASYGRNRGVGI